MGSEIEADFTNLTADQLNAKYPMKTVVNGRTMIPLRFPGEKLGGTVSWIQETKEAIWLL